MAKYLTTVNGQTFEVEIEQDGRITVNGTERTIDFQHITEALYSAIINNKSIEALVEERDNKYQVLMRGDQYEVEVLDEREQRLMRSSSGFAVSQGELSIRSPMPGLIVDVKVSAGQQVEKGMALVVLESMKMENDIKAPRAGTVVRVHIAKGDSVEQNRVLITLS
ncbi:MAG: biotin/lipoyl-binding protein [Anaerolinea sp.]|nr:biotin/lipoyl-binding protein [Anaerolinea sp.]MCC6974918.1 biotin/lipoyl-binding protein [Anaerolineae bacterium]CAG1012295.1 biotin carboxyl carrier protein [Anaerolineae bacterium]